MYVHAAQLARRVCEKHQHRHLPPWCLAAAVRLESLAVAPSHTLPRSRCNPPSRPASPLIGRPGCWVNPHLAADDTIFPSLSPICLSVNAMPMPTGQGKTRILGRLSVASALRCVPSLFACLAEGVDRRRLLASIWALPSSPPSVPTVRPAPAGQLDDAMDVYVTGCRAAAARCHCLAGALAKRARPLHVGFVVSVLAGLLQYLSARHLPPPPHPSWGMSRAAGWFCCGERFVRDSM